MSQQREPITTEAQAGSYLEGLINFEREPDFRYERLGLEPVRRVLDALGDPHDPLSVVHIAGSKGKGSTALLVEALLGALGERVGTFTSPHFDAWTERFRVGGRPVDGARLAAAVERIRGPVDRLRAADAGARPTFFDATTAAALVLFAEEQVDRAVLEVGLGGRLDSTNVVTPAVACITTIELEHVDKLGGTRREIAGEKAGILKPGVPAVVGRLPSDALEVVARRASELGADPWLMGEDFDVSARRSADGLSLGIDYCDRAGARVEAVLPVLGEHQADNAALALACVRRLGFDAEAVSAAASRAWASVTLPGRVELVGRRPWRVVDGAHTLASARALARALEPLRSDARHLVLSVSAGKDLSSILDALLPGISTVTVTRAEPRRSLDPASVAAAVGATGHRAELRVVPNPHLAVRAAREAVGPGGMIVATGSVYLVGIARAAWADGPDAPVQVTRRPATGTPTPVRRA